MFLTRFVSCPLGFLHLFLQGKQGPVLPAGVVLLYTEYREELFWSFPILKMYSFVDVIFFLKPGGGEEKQPQPFKEGRPMGIFGVLPSH